MNVINESGLYNLTLGLKNTTKALLRLDTDAQTLISIQGISGGVGNPNANHLPAALGAGWVGARLSSNGAT